MPWVLEELKTNGHFSQIIIEVVLTLGIAKQDLSLLVQAVRHGLPVNSHIASGYSPLLLAAKLGDMAALISLLDHGADANAAEGDEWTSLMFIARIAIYVLIVMMY
jgi:ankyrin repeat protein